MSVPIPYEIFNHNSFEDLFCLSSPLRASSGNAGGCYPNNPSWVLNPQHRFEVASQTGAKVALQLSNKRYQEEIERSRKGQGSGPPSIGLCVFDMGEIGDVGGMHCCQ